MSLYDLYDQKYLYLRYVCTGKHYSSDLKSFVFFWTFLFYINPHVSKLWTGLVFISKLLHAFTSSPSNQNLLAPQQTFAGLEDVFRTSLKETKCLLGISVSIKSKSVSNKSIYHKSISDESMANPKCIG